MSINVYNIKRNRKIYSTMCDAFVKGLKKHNVAYKYYDKLRTPKSCDLAVCFTNAPSTKKIIEKQYEDRNKYLRLDRGRFRLNGITNIKNRNDLEFIYCNLLDKDYISNYYIKNKPNDRLIKFNNFGIQIRPFKTKGCVLIPEQVRPEGGYNKPEKLRGHKFDSWIEWSKNICNLIKSKTDLQVRIRRHPNRNFWKDFNDHVEEVFNDIEFSYGEKVDLKQDLKDVSRLITISSKCSIEAFFNGVNIFVEDKSSVVKDVSNKMNNLESPTKFNRQQWLQDMSYTHWTIDEISNGDYWQYYKTFLERDEA